jgi:hypothetical protein
MLVRNTGFRGFREGPWRSRSRVFPTHRRVPVPRLVTTRERATRAHGAVFRVRHDDVVAIEAIYVKENRC